MMPKPRLLGAFVMALLCCAATAPAWAQESISREIISTTSALTAGQQQQVDAYVGRWVRQAIAGTDDQIVRSREKLLEPFALGGSRIFHTAYSTALNNQLPQALQSDRPLARLNTMLVVGRMLTAEAVQLVRRGLEDDSPAVRFAAAKAGGQLASREENPMARPDLQALLTTLGAAMEHEQQQIVVEQLLLAMASIDLPEAVDALLTSLNRRVNLHAQQPDLGLNADTEAITRVYRRLVLFNGQTGPTFQNLVRKMARVAFRRLDLSAQLLQEAGLSPHREAEHRRMVVDGDRILRWAIGSHLAANANLPDRIESALQAGNLGEVRLRIEEWRTLLTSQTVGMSRDDLATQQ